MDTIKEKRDNFIRLLANRAKQSDINRWSVSIAYYVMLSLFPILIIIGTVLPYFNIPSEMIILYLDSIIPAPILDVIEPTLTGLFTVPNGGLLSIGILATLWSASKGMKFVQSGVDSAYGIKGSRLYVTSRIASIAIFLVIILLFIAFMVMSSLGGPLIESLLLFFGWSPGVLRQFNFIKWVGSFLGMFLTFMIIYRITPNIEHRFRDVLSGSLLATICLMALVQIYAVFLTYSAKSLTAYGVLSGFFVLMVWLKLLGYVILLGAVLNATVFEMRNGTPCPKEGKFDSWLQQKIDKTVGYFKDKLSLRKKEPSDEAPE